ncbi:G1/S-specific cyclin-D2-like [Babylonia areolata]|uniref:G1/S-specific cyclin-D2-like n=1 Tax=Babylonia areolata TaxID=304850 RepID=UPI003FD5F3E2
MADRLICMESNRVTRAFEDPVLLHDIRVLKNLLEAEEKYVPQSSYFNCVQTDIKPYMRRMVTEWMGEVCVEQNTEEEVFPLAVNYLDRFLGIQNIPRNKLQCLGAACMFLASKLKENYHISAEQLVIYTDNSITLTDLREMESTVLQVLKWDLSAITPCDFVAQIVHRLALDPAKVAQVKQHANIFIKFCATDNKFMLYTPSMVAAGCVCVSVIAVNASYPALMQSLCNITSIDMEVLKACQDSIQQIVATYLTQYVRQHNLTSTPLVDTQLKNNHPVVSQSTTPTDVRDINLVAVDDQNRLMSQ